MASITQNLLDAGIIYPQADQIATIQSVQSLGLYAVSNTTHGSSGTKDARSLTLAGAGIVSVGITNGSIVISATGGGGGGLTNVNLSAGTTSQNLSNFVFSNSNGVSFGLNGSTVTAAHNALTSQSNQALSAANGSFTFQTATFADSNGVSFSTGTQGLYATVKTDYLTSQSNQAFSAQGGSSAFQTLSFANSNGLTFSNSNGSVVASYTVPTITNSAWTASDNATSGTVARLAFTNLNGVTLSLSTGAGGSHTIIGSHNALTSQSNQALSGSNGSFTFQTATFGNLNGLSFYSSNGSMVGSYSVPTQSNQTLGLYAVSNTTQSSSGTVDARTLSFQGAGVASVGVSNGSVIVSVPAGGGGLTNVNLSAGTTSQNLSAFVLSNSNNISFGLNGSTITASADAGGGGGFTASMFPFSPVAMATSSAYSGATTTTAGGSRTTLSVYISPFILDQAVSYDQVFAHISRASVAGTGSFTAGLMWALYTRDASTLNQLSSWMMGVQHSQSSITAVSQRWWWGTNSAANSSSIGGNVSASVNGVRMALLSTGGASLSGGNYWLAYGWTNSSAGAAVGSYSLMCASFSQSTAGSQYGTNASTVYMPLIGIASTTITSNAAHVFILPSSIHTSALTQTGGSSQNRSNVIFFARQAT